MKIVIELDVDASDFSTEDAKRFIEEAKDASGISVEVGRPIDDEHEDGPFRTDSLRTEYFKATLITSEERNMDKRESDQRAEAAPPTVQRCPGCGSEVIRNGERWPNAWSCANRNCSEHRWHYEYGAQTAESTPPTDERNEDYARQLKEIKPLCSRCNGNGTLPTRNGEGKINGTMTCPDCEGDGRFIDWPDRCTRCGAEMQSNPATIYCPICDKQSTGIEEFLREGKQVAYEKWRKAEQELKIANGKLELLNSFYASDADETENEKLARAVKELIELKAKLAGAAQTPGETCLTHDELLSRAREFWRNSIDPAIGPKTMADFALNEIKKLGHSPAPAPQTGISENSQGHYAAPPSQSKEKP